MRPSICTFITLVNTLIGVKRHWEPADICISDQKLTIILHKNEDWGYYKTFQVKIFVRENVKKVTHLYLHASVSGYTCMQAYPGGNTKRGKWVQVKISISTLRNKPVSLFKPATLSFPKGGRFRRFYCIFLYRNFKYHTNFSH